MPEERDIEKTLRAWAKRRREDAGAPVELHPATRNLLQAEVSRLKAAPRREPHSLARWLWGTPLRLALNMSAVVVLVVAVVLVLPQLRQPSSNISAGRLVLADKKSKDFENAQPAVGASDSLQPRQKEPPVARERALLDAGKAAPVTNNVFLADSVTLYKNKTPAPSTPVSAATSVAPPTPEREQLVENAGSAQALVPGNAPAPATALAAAAPVPETTFAAGAPAMVVQTNSWISAQAAADRRSGVVAAKSVPAALSFFRTEQDGNQFRVIDADGSIYTGSLTASVQGLVSDGMVAPAQTRFFRVSGTNITRNQPVIFSGSLVVDTQTNLRTKEDVSGGTVVAGSAGFGGGGGFGGRDMNGALASSNVAVVHGAAVQAATTAGALAPTLAPRPQFRVQGTALVGTNTIQINAVPVAP